MPKILRAVAIASAVIFLAGCQSAPQPDASSQACVPTTSGDASAQVDVTGEVLQLPVVTFPNGLTADATQRSVIVEGDGAVAQEGSLVTFGYVAYNGTTGETVDSVGYGGSPLTQATIDPTALMPGLLKALQCTTVGSRVAAVVTPADAFGDTGNEQFGIAAGDSIVFVIDVASIAKDRADGVDQPPQDGMPTVVLDDNGEPTITIPDATAPTDLRIAVLKQGDGAVVAAGATVTVEYKGVLWANGETFDSSWTRPEPAQFATTDVVEGFGAAMVGQAVGSQILVVIPPALGYGSTGNQDGSITGTDTMVFVIDILATV